MTDLPESVQEIAEVIGREKALRLIGAVGKSGSRSWRVCFYVPKKLRENHPFIEIIGKEAAEKLCLEFSGMILQPSNCNFIYRNYRNKQIRHYAQQGISHAQIAHMLDLSKRQIYNILKQEIPPEVRKAANDNIRT